MQLRTVQFIFKLWVASIATLVIVMVLVGGITRLSDSGLSMVRWELIKGIMPPQTDAQWMSEFYDYQQSPQYQLVTKGMSLDAFKGIYFWEWVHRVLGRFVGFVALVGAVFFGLSSVSRVFKISSFLILGWVIIQGLAGWFMVKSGLVNEPAVDHYRLATHLSLAFGLFVYCIYLLVGDRFSRLNSIGFLRRLSIGLFVLVCLQVIFGAFVAGLDAGIGYNTFPLMNGKFTPPDSFSLSASWIQYIHRWLGISVGFVGIALCTSQFFYDVPKLLRILIIAITIMLLIQIGLGIATLIYVVPMNLALAHQLMALFLLASIFLLISPARLTQ